LRMVVMERGPHFMHPVKLASMSQAVCAAALVGSAACFSKALHWLMRTAPDRGIRGKGAKAAPRAWLVFANSAAVHDLESLKQGVPLNTLQAWLIVAKVSLRRFVHLK